MTDCLLCGALFMDEEQVDLTSDSVYSANLVCFSQDTFNICILCAIKIRDKDTSVYDDMAK